MPTLPACHPTPKFACCRLLLTTVVGQALVLLDVGLSLSSVVIYIISTYIPNHVSGGEGEEGDVSGPVSTPPWHSSNCRIVPGTVPRILP
jgi:hypothetical protein